MPAIEAGVNRYFEKYRNIGAELMTSRSMFPPQRKADAVD
jgi:hypothetical protein